MPPRVPTLLILPAGPATQHPCCGFHAAPPRPPPWPSLHAPPRAPPPVAAAIPAREGRRCPQV